MKTLLTYCLILSVFSADLIRFAVYVDFTIHQDFIAEVLCINKEKPRLSCDGKCHLAEQLKKVDQEGESTVPTNREQKEVKPLFLFIERISNPLIHIQDSFLSQGAMRYANGLLAGFQRTVFHPPQR